MPASHIQDRGSRTWPCALQKIIVQSAILLPVDYDTWMIVLYSLSPQEGKRWPSYTITGINLFLHNRAVFKPGMPVRVWFLEIALVRDVGMCVCVCVCVCPPLRL